MIDEQHLTTERFIELIENDLEDNEFPGKLSVAQDSIIVDCFSGSQYQIVVSVLPIYLKPAMNKEGTTPQIPSEE